MPNSLTQFVSDVRLAVGCMKASSDPVSPVVTPSVVDVTADVGGVVCGPEGVLDDVAQAVASTAAATRTTLNEVTLRSLRTSTPGGRVTRLSAPAQDSLTLSGATDRAVHVVLEQP